MTSSKAMCTSTSPETGAHADRDRGRRSQWYESETTKEFHDRLGAKVREGPGRDAEPTAGVIDSQSVKADAVVGSDSRGFDGGKLINGRKRHVVVDAGACCWA
ncbi:hypothetical protein ACFXDH_38325 [Streptomyces sp. NPDC059467]|uniref:hypothetical protein n=1 Tax=Streptomyces sp. NPDC059467 TaxID=3346844 RepID=UPI00369DE085